MNPAPSLFVTVTIWALLALLVVHAALAAASVLLTRRIERALPPAGRFVTAPDGTRVHYRESGSPGAPPLVLVHGASANLRDFDASLRPGLETRFRVIAVDRPGSGWSEPNANAQGDPLAQADHVVAVLDALGIERAVWVGHSWGGAVVMAALVERPERVVAGVAIAAATHPWEESLPRPIRLGALPVVGPLLSATWVTPLGRVALNDALADSFRPESPPDPIERYREATGADLAIRPRAFRTTALDLAGLAAALERLAPRYGDIERPLLLVNGAADPLIPPERHADRVRDALPAARSLRIDGAGHIVHHTHTDAVVDAIVTFADEIGAD